MSHVDEGTLHAYLDGALDTLPAAEAERVRRHLAACDVCQARLDEERSVRDEAAAILGGVTPDLGDLPSFEEVRARARGTTPVAEAGFRLQRLAWAASVVLALGTGWLLRGGVPQPAERVPAARQDAAQADPAPTATVATPSPGGGEVADVPAPANEAPADAVASEAERAQAPGRPVQSRGVATGSLRDAPTGAAEAALPKVAEELDARVTTEVAARPPSGDSADVVADAPVAAVWSAARLRREAQATAQSFAAAAAAPNALAGGRPQAPVTEEARRVISAAESSIPVRADALEPADAMEPAAGSLVVPGLPVVSVVWLDEPRLAGAVRVLQLMEDGDTLELVHLPAGVDPALLPPIGDGRTQVLSPREGGWLVARAHGSAGALSALLRRLEGGN